MIPTDEARGEIVNKYVRAADYICRLPTVIDQVADACRYYQYFRQNTRVLFPAPSGPSNLCFVDYGPLDPASFTNPARPLLLVPLFKTDGRYGQLWQTLCDRQASGQYWRPQNLLIVSAEFTETQIVCGLSVLHEIMHAYLALQEGQVGQAATPKFSMAYLAEERDVNLFEGKLLHALNRYCYEKIMDSDIMWLEQLFQPQYRGVGMPIVDLPDQRNGLTVMLQPITNEQHWAARIHHWRILVYLTAFDRWLPQPQATEAQLNFLARIYQQFDV